LSTLDRPAVVSCIIPTHGRDALLEQALTSITRQSGDFPIDVVVVDDLSSMVTEELVRKFENTKLPRFRFSYEARASTPGSGGASGSRNQGAAVAQGKYLAFLDDDDLWDEKYLENAVDALVQSEADLAVTWMNVLERDGTVAPLLSIREGLVPGDVVSRNPGVTGSNIVIDRNVYSTMHGFDEHLPVSNDKDFFVRFLLGGYSYVAVVHRSAIHRRHSGDQLTRPNERRALGLELYLTKHKSLMRRRDRRFLLQHIHSIRSKTSSTFFRRKIHLVGSILNYSRVDLISKFRPGASGNGRYTSV
jgi:glycosyltransferase involved in cell wall biosynthesis